MNEVDESKHTIKNKTETKKRHLFCLSPGIATEKDVTLIKCIVSEIHIFLLPDCTTFRK